MNVCTALLPEKKRLEAAVGPVSRETFRELQIFCDIFVQWNRSVNLISNATVEQLWDRHIIDSAQLVNIAPNPRTWIDLGTGGGFPGLIVAIILRNRTVVHLIESNRKKAAFLQVVIGTLQLPTVVHAGRIENMRNFVGPADVVSSRALSALSSLLPLSEHWLASGAKGLFMKGRDYRSELREIADEWTFQMLEHPSRTESGSVVLEFWDVSRRSMVV